MRHYRIFHRHLLAGQRRRCACTGARPPALRALLFSPRDRRVLRNFVGTPSPSVVVEVGPILYTPSVHRRVGRTWEGRKYQPLDDRRHREIINKYKWAFLSPFVRDDVRSNASKFDDWEYREGTWVGWLVNEANRMMHSSLEDCTLRGTGGCSDFLQLKNANLPDASHLSS